MNIDEKVTLYNALKPYRAFLMEQMGYCDHETIKDWYSVINADDETLNKWLNLINDLLINLEGDIL